jgi:rod shape-determining protein MreD
MASGLEALLRRAPPEEILRPVKMWWVALTLVVAFIFNLLPWSGITAMVKPDLFALTLLFWCIREPRLVGVGVAWICGLFTDVVEGNLLGQHALAYAILAYAAGYFYRRVLRFSLWPQALHVLVLLLVAQLVIVATRIMSGAAIPSPTVYLSAVSGALIWPVLTMLLLLPQRPRESE